MVVDRRVGWALAVVLVACGDAGSSSTGGAGSETGASGSASTSGGSTPTSQGSEPTGGASMTGDDVLANNWNIIQRDSDIQYGIPHIPLPPFPPCVLALLWTAISGSKSYFGPSSVLGNGKPIAAAPMSACRKSVGRTSNAR